MGICGIHGNIKWSSLILCDALCIAVTKVIQEIPFGLDFTPEDWDWSAS